MRRLQGDSKQEPTRAGSETPEISIGDGGKGGSVLSGGGDNNFLQTI